MTATSRAREALAALSPQVREANQVLVVLADLLIEQNEHLARLLEQGRAGTASITVNNTAPAHTPQGAGRPAVEAPPASQAAPDTQEEPVKLTEPDRPPVDPDDDPAQAAPAAPRATKAAKAAPTKTTTAKAGKAGTR